MKMKHVIGALAICMVAATAAQATTYEVRWDGTVSPGTGAHITSSWYHGDTSAGVYNLQVKIAPPDVTNVSSFCVDVLNHCTTTWNWYTLIELEAAPMGSGNPVMGSTNGKADDIRKLYGTYGPDVVGTMTNDQAAAFQAAVWEIVYETSGTAYTVSSDNMIVGISANATTAANNMLSAIWNDREVDEMAMDDAVMVLASDSLQDFAITTISSTVPEPLTMASAFFAIGGLGAYIRRRTGRAAA